MVSLLHLLCRLSFANLVALGCVAQEEEHRSSHAWMLTGFGDQDYVWSSSNELLGDDLFSRTVCLVRLCGPGWRAATATVLLHPYGYHWYHVGLERHGCVSSTLKRLVTATVHGMDNSYPYRVYHSYDWGLRECIFAPKHECKS